MNKMRLICQKSNDGWSFLFMKMSVKIRGQVDKFSTYPRGEFQESKPLIAFRKSDFWESQLMDWSA
jgi:hypothetical protein